MQTQKINIKMRPLGPIMIDDRHVLNLYFIEKLGHRILIELPPIEHFVYLKEEVNKFTSIDTLTDVILLNPTISLVSVLNELVASGFKGNIITVEEIAKDIFPLNLDLHIKTIKSLNYELKSKETIILQFIDMHFLPYPEMFMVYEPSYGLLFSSLLMSSYYQKDYEPTIHDIERFMFAFHKENMPSSDYVKPVIRQLSSFDLKLLLPSYGYMIESQQMNQVMELMKRIDFHNNYFMNSKVGQAKPDLNYIELINQLITALIKHFPRIEILNTFIGTPFNLDHETLLLKKTSLVEYKIWHQFFEVVYAKKGMSWLILMEPTMHKLIDRYQLELPSIYRTETIKLQEETRNLEAQKVALELHLKTLNDEIEQAKDQLLRDAKTKLYTQNVLKQMMYEHFEKPLDQGNTRGLLLIQLDQLISLNKKYGKEIGNEAIEHLVYVLDQVKSKEVMLFKENGPGIYALIDGTKEAFIMKEALKMRNAVAESTHFIEKVTISIALVTCQEIDEKLHLDEKIDYIFSTIEKRMAYAKMKENGVIIDSQTELPESYEGAILLVDQDEINRNMLFRIFRRIHFNVIMAESVDQALEIMDAEKIDIVISEINLSKLDGFQLKMRMNESKAFKDIPFIMVSHNKSVDNIKRGNLLDVDLILEKPIIPDELIGHVIRLKGR
ncbi:MAG: hypothetical protein CVV61_00230 [Tenericutes bacterium HGW-Tenericutes-6]|nr:MAG: hypothetical protein CVV61_00230 [Tenericutes bacterium HGW-Tenericutes-6]